nr:hypothetical protein [Bacillota bacterium]
MGIVIPNDFSDRLKRGKNVPVLTIIDGSNMLFSNSASSICPSAGRRSRPLCCWPDSPSPWQESSTRPASFPHNQVQTIQATMLIAVPSFLLSGFTWPFEAIPKLLSWLGHCLPLTYFVGGVHESFVKGHGWDIILRTAPS